MLRKINNAQVVSDEGFKVKINRTYISYQEGSKAIHIDAEYALNPVRLVIYKDSIIKWFKPNESILITESDRNVILEKVRKALKFLGFEFEIA